MSSTDNGFQNQREAKDEYSQISQTVSELKALDTFGNSQRPVFSLGVSQHA